MADQPPAPGAPGAGPAREMQVPGIPFAMTEQMVAATEFVFRRENTATDAQCQIVWNRLHRYFGAQNNAHRGNVVNQVIAYFLLNGTSGSSDYHGTITVNGQDYDADRLNAAVRDVCTLRQFARANADYAVFLLKRRVDLNDKMQDVYGCTAQETRLVFDFADAQTGLSGLESATIARLRESHLSRRGTRLAGNRAFAGAAAATTLGNNRVGDPAPE